MTIAAPSSDLFGTPETSANFRRPFLKWAGNKVHILQHLLPHLAGGPRLIEPFVGSGAVFLNAPHRRFLLSDANSDVIGLYRMLQTQPQRLRSEVEALFVPENNQSEEFYRLRADFNATRDDLRRAALFVYLNRHCFNGLCRYNSKGAFNTPFGRYREPAPPLAAMEQFAEKLASVELTCGDFEVAMDSADPGDVIYCDPPYVPLSETANFTAYKGGGFSGEDQERLALAARRASSRGVKVVLSNHDTPWVRELYTGAHISELEAPRFISRDVSTRRPVREVIAVFLPT